MYMQTTNPDTWISKWKLKQVLLPGSFTKPPRLVSGVARSGCFLEKSGLKACCLVPEARREQQAAWWTFFIMDHARRDRQRAERLSHDNTISRLPNFLPLSHLAGPLTCCQLPAWSRCLACAALCCEVSVRSWTLTPGKLSSHFPGI